MTVVIAEDADRLWTVGSLAPREKVTRHLIINYLGRPVQGFSDFDYLKIVLDRLTELELDYKIDTISDSAKGLKEVSFAILESTDRNLLGIGAACSIGSAAAAAFYDFYH